MKLKSQRSRVGYGPWQCSSEDRIDHVRARLKVGNVPVAMFLSRAAMFLRLDASSKGTNVQTGKDRVNCPCEQ